MTRNNDPPPPVCARFHQAVELIGGRWTGAIIQTLLQGKTRYALIKAAIPDITDRMLSERLRSLESEELLTRRVVPDITDRMLSERLRFLESEELVTRRVIPESPVRVEYELTEKGRSLESSLNEIGTWAERWISLEDDSESRAASTELKARKRPA